MASCAGDYCSCVAAQSIETTRPHRQFSRYGTAHRLYAPRPHRRTLAPATFSRAPVRSLGGTVVLPQDTAQMANVLIVDDDVDGCRPLARLLQVVGHSPFFVHDGRAALSLLDQLRPDMILLDVMMPGLNGIDVLKTIRAHPVHKDLPVVVFSALGDDETRDAALASGAQEYLIKSKADFEQIRACIESHLPA